MCIRSWVVGRWVAGGKRKQQQRVLIQLGIVELVWQGGLRESAPPRPHAQGKKRQHHQHQQLHPFNPCKETSLTVAENCPAAAAAAAAALSQDPPAARTENTTYHRRKHRPSLTTLSNWNLKHRQQRQPAQKIPFQAAVAKNIGYMTKNTQPVSIRNVGDPIAINWKVIMEHGEFTWNGGFLGYNSVDSTRCFSSKTWVDEIRYKVGYKLVSKSMNH